MILHCIQTSLTVPAIHHVFYLVLIQTWFDVFCQDQVYLCVDAGAALLCVLFYLLYELALDGKGEVCFLAWLYLSPHNVLAPLCASHCGSVRMLQIGHENCSKSLPQFLRAITFWYFFNSVPHLRHKSMRILTIRTDPILC